MIGEIIAPHVQHVLPMVDVGTPPVRSLQRGALARSRHGIRILVMAMLSPGTRPRERIFKDTKGSIKSPKKNERRHSYFRLFRHTGGVTSQAYAASRAKYGAFDWQ